MKHRNDIRHDVPVLLIARVAREQRRGYLALAFIGLVITIGLLGLGVWLNDILIIAVPSFLAATLLLLYTLAALDRPFFRGDVYSSVIANSKTIAVKYRRGRIRFLKRRDCIACNDNGTVLFDSEGRRYPIVVQGLLGYDHDDHFLTPFYAKWWPGTRLDAIRRHASENGCGIFTSLLAKLLGNAPFFIAIYACLFHDVHMMIAFLAMLFLTPICEWVVLRTNLDGTWAYRYPLDSSAECERYLKARHVKT